jgi:hypothetical protein
MSQTDKEREKDPAEVAPSNQVAGDPSITNAVESEPNPEKSKTKDTVVEPIEPVITSPKKDGDDDQLRKRQEEELLKQCQDVYSEMFKGSENEPWFKPPKLNEEGKIQLSFKDDNQTEDFLKKMAEKNPNMGFIVTQGDKVLGYATPGGGYTKNDGNLTFEQCNQKIQDAYKKLNEPKQDSDLNLRGAAPIEQTGSKASPLTNQAGNSAAAESALGKGSNLEQTKTQTQDLSTR